MPDRTSDQAASFLSWLMTQPSDFRIFAVQLVAITPDIDRFSTPLFFSKIIPRFATRYDGEIESAIPPKQLKIIAGKSIEVPLVPAVSLTSANQRWQLKMIPDRVESIWFAKSDDNRHDLRDRCDECLKPLLTYPVEAEIRVGRLALIVHRSAPSDDPARAISEHFCRPEFIAESNPASPLRHSKEFQIHNLKTYTSPIPSVAVNSWVRCITGSGENAKSIVFNQDLNTLGEETEVRAFTREEIIGFFGWASGEMDHILELYFSADQHQ